MEHENLAVDNGCRRNLLDAMRPMQATVVVSMLACAGLLMLSIHERGDRLALESELMATQFQMQKLSSLAQTCAAVVGACRADFERVKARNCGT